MDFCRDFYVIAINNAIRLAPWAPMLLGGDLKWWNWNGGCEWYEGRKVSASRQACKKYTDLEFLEPTGLTGFEPSWGKVRTGGNSGYVAIQLAAQLGYKKILLLGYDFQPTAQGQHHWHEPHQSNAHPNYGLCLPRFDTLLPGLREMGVEVINCSSHSALRSFPCQDLTSACTSSTKTS